MTKVKLLLMLSLLVGANSPILAGTRLELQTVCTVTGYQQSVCFFTAPDGRSCALSSRGKTGSCD